MAPGMHSEGRYCMVLILRSAHSYHANIVTGSKFMTTALCAATGSHPTRSSAHFDTRTAQDILCVQIQKAYLIEARLFGHCEGDLAEFFDRLG